MPPHRHQFSIKTPQPFDLQLALTGHGWYDLAPHEFHRETSRFATAMQVGRLLLDVEFRPAREGLRVRVEARRALERAELAAVRFLVQRMLRLDEDLSEFHEHCAGSEGRLWVVERGAGRLLRSASIFEDLMKLLFTTNCSWALTRSMCRNLVAAAGRRAPSGRRAFPGPRELRGRDESFWREDVRVGYRAAGAMELVERFLDGELSEERIEAARERGKLRELLLGIRGFGPYAAGQAARLLGDYEELALDSWCRARLAEMEGRRRPPTDAAVARRYRPWGRWAGLALWLDLTRDWHLRDEGPPEL